LDDLEHRRRLEAAKDALSEVVVDPSITMLCAALAARFRVPGHRGELVLLRASRALAAIKGNAEVRPEHVRQVAQPALLHRRSGAESPTLPAWTAADEQTVDEVIAERATTVP
jgi:magnesium chelatase subunit I